MRPSPIAGLGAFATEPIRKGTRVIEYLGERITPKEADRRYNDDASKHPHVLLFSVDGRTVIDAGVRGNEARFINHSCEPNCEAVTDKRRVFIEALRDIKAGEELLYDYNLTRQDDDAPDLEERYACYCGSKTCRGTMLTPTEVKKKRRDGVRAR
ncbi:MAG TPA: SET domain-containing protein-lysine N-methyltransferase [Polyangiaceae bacterium]